MEENRKTITYLFGAGASINALPVVNQIPKTLKWFIEEIRDKISIHLPDDQFYKGLSLQTSKRDYQKRLLETLVWMKEGTESHASIDTFAKKLLATRQIDKLRKLKAGLICFFTYIQHIKLVDPRYDSFIAALINPLQSINNLPGHLKILSWNYDFQIEKAYSSYSGKTSLIENQILLNVKPSEINVDIHSSSPNQFTVFKINGTTGIFDMHENFIDISVDKIESKQDTQFLMDAVVKTFAAIIDYPRRFLPLINFAWETDALIKQIIEEAISATKNTKVLVVIGYSFPFFNREIDRKIIQSMSGLKTVYFQAPNEHAKEIRERFRAIRKDYNDLNLVVYNDCDQFFLPPEL